MQIQLYSFQELHDQQQVVTPFIGSGKFFIKAVDKFGVRSATSSSVVIAQQVIDGVKPVTNNYRRNNFYRN
jgi:hypothetical protein